MRRFNDSLPGRIITVNLAALVAAGLSYLVYLANRGIVPAVLQWALVFGIGLVAGLAGRGFLAQRTFLLRLLTVLLALLISLVFLGLVSRGVLGTLLPESSQNSLNLSWLGQFILASAAAMLSLSAWKISPQSKNLKKSSRPGQRTRSTSLGPKKVAPARAAGSAGSKKIRQAGSPKRPASRPKKAPSIVQPDFWNARLENLQGKLRHWWEHGLVESLHRPPRVGAHGVRPTGRVQLKRPRRLAPSKPITPSSVRLVGVEEHRCPFCLEVVTRNDPRGVRICPICHTHHHADCWDVTGTCQVPHYHE
jgi:hypothetical protein